MSIRLEAAVTAICLAASIAVGYALLDAANSFWALVLTSALPLSYFFSRARGWAHPLAWFPASFAIYFLLGSRNWIVASDSAVDFRRHVGDSALRLPVLACTIFCLGVLAAEATFRNHWSTREAPLDDDADAARGAAYRIAARLCFCVGSLAVVAVIHRIGVPLFHPSARSQVPGSLRLGSSLLIPAGVLAAERLERKERFVIIACSLVELVLLAYRTPVLLLVLTLGVLRLLRGQITTRAAASCALILIVGSTSLYTFRLAHGNGVASGVTATGALRYAPILTPLYYSYAREGVAVWSRIADVVPSTAPFFDGRVQDSAFLSLLPGRQASPRLTVSALAYGTSRPTTTLTPTIIGGPYLDFGALGIAVEMFILGLILTWMYIRVSLRANDGVLTRDIAYAYAAALVLLSIHTGLLDGVLVAALPAVAVGIVSVCAISVARPGSARTRSGFYREPATSRRDA